MTIVVKIPASKLPIKIKDIDLDFFNSNVFDTSNKNDAIEYLSDKPCLIKFYADWWGPCKVLSPVLDELANDYTNVVDFYKVNIDDNLEMASMFGVRGVPTLIILSKDSRPALIPSVANKIAIKEAIDTFINGEVLDS